VTGTTQNLAGWGNYPRAEVRAIGARGRAEALAVVRAESSLIARGNGRAYGDAALNSGATLLMTRSNRLMAFDETTGLLTCEAGVLLSDILDLFVPRGWFVPVTPGTKFVTIGGMIAADVHGKNHHGAGSFGEHVESLDLALADGSVVSCSRTHDPELFAATCGGMGLTGVILSASFRLMRIESPFIRQETHRTANLAETVTLLNDMASWTYSVAWIDCLATGKALGRSIVFLGDHATQQEARAAKARETSGLTLAMPVNAPAFALNRWTVSAFNELYYKKERPRSAVIFYDGYFYPLDAIHDWNKLYGRAGFVQYQCVLPKSSAAIGMETLLQRISHSGRGSFLSVLKQFRPQDGLLSFPMEGLTLALDFAVDRQTLALLTELDAIVADHGGRLYLAKDARWTAQHLQRGYPRLDEFLAIRRRVDPSGKFSSLLSQRLGL
jgi:FAD/FMN-containing dehydrogenase